MANGSVEDLSLPDDLNLPMGYQQGLQLLETRLGQDTELQERLVSVLRILYSIAFSNFDDVVANVVN
jgi:hypothetical protein